MNSREMKWEKLLSETRERKSNSTTYSFRNCFDMDYDRIVSSSSVRRLQDKAQVFPLQENDFTRTRLTHSLEVSAIGRSMGLNIESKLIEKDLDPYFNKNENKGKLASLLMVTGLVHDLGNPPFGHYGEDVIKSWFKTNKDKITRYGIESDKLNDFLKFDGNAQTIRILTRLQCLNDKCGINFCFGTLATLMKYPWSSADERCGKGKFGYFASERELYDKIMNETGVISRHPATYLLEAADDITYLFADLEDALKKRCFDFNDFIEKFRKEFSKEYKEYIEILNGDGIEERSPHEKATVKMQNFKIKLQGKMIHSLCDEFINSYDSIMRGEYIENKEKPKSLISSSEFHEVEAFIRGYCVENVYNNKEVLTLELVGKEVLDNLLDKFVFAALETTKENCNPCDQKLFKLISENFKYIHVNEAKDNLYERIQIVVDYISGMTDSYALNLNKKLLGMRL